MTSGENNTATPAPRKRRRWLIPVLCVFAVILVFEFVVVQSVVSALMKSEPGVRVKVVKRGDESVRIAVISLDEAIMGGGSHAAGSGMAHQMMKQLRSAAEDARVKAVILQVDSPGGGLQASDLIHNEIVRLEDANKPVIAYVNGLAASGGYYVIAPARRIVAIPTSLIGSIGVVMPYVNVSELLDKVGVDPEPIKTAQSKDIGSPFRPMKPDERAYFQELLDGFHARFVEVISTGRDMSVEEVRRLANGKIYPAEEARKLGLVDTVGYFDAALDAAMTEAGVSNPTIVRYQSGSSLPFSLLGLADSTDGADVVGALDAGTVARRIIDMAQTPRFEARWRIDQ